MVEETPAPPIVPVPPPARSPQDAAPLVIPANWQRSFVTIAVVVAVVILYFLMRGDWVRYREYIETCCNTSGTRTEFKEEPLSATEMLRFYALMGLAFLAILFLLIQVLIYAVGYFRPLQTPNDHSKEQTQKIWTLLIGGVIAFAFKPEGEIHKKGDWSERTRGTTAVPGQSAPGIAGGPTQAGFIQVQAVAPNGQTVILNLPIYNCPNCSPPIGPAPQGGFIPRPSSSFDEAVPRRMPVPTTPTT